MKMRPEGRDKSYDGGKYGTLLAPTKGVSKPVTGSGLNSREGFAAVTSSQSGKDEPRSPLEREGRCTSPVPRRRGGQRGRRNSKEEDENHEGSVCRFQKFEFHSVHNRES